MKRFSSALRPSLWQVAWLTAAHFALSAALYAAAWSLAFRTSTGALYWIERSVVWLGTAAVYPLLYWLAPLLQPQMSLMSAVALGVLANSALWGLLLAVMVNGLRQWRRAASGGDVSA